ncbi:MAG TPA: GNAT family N-acetyltransferase [Atopostipes sp.]|nr:GNAT family N-acetyltransferase [Atopostipes sp.]
MDIKFKEYTNYQESEILELYQAVGWRNYYEKPKMLEEAYKQSLDILGAYHEGQLVGILRVVGDGASIIYIQDILVRPEFQRRGIGRQLFELVMSKYANVYQKVLITDDTEKTKAFYKSMGFSNLEETTGVCFISYTF